MAEMSAAGDGAWTISKVGVRKVWSGRVRRVGKVSKVWRAARAGRIAGGQGR